jgi:hypothetical protein
MKRGGKPFFYIITYYILCEKVFFLIFRFISFAYETTLEWTEDFWFKCWFCIVHFTFIVFQHVYSYSLSHLTRFSSYNFFELEKGKLEINIPKIFITHLPPNEKGR